jgi:cytosine/adenosine deaminase-related metal-dependent hydrolase
VNFSAAAAEALSCGTTAVGEIAGPDLSAYAACPLRARVFVEGIGLSPGVADQALADVTTGVGKVEAIVGANPLVRAGVSPHTLYTVGERLLRSLSALAAGKKLPACLHLAEHPAESEFLADGSGEIGEKLYRGLGIDVSWFRGIGLPLHEYLRHVGLLREGLLLAHNVHLARPEIDALREGGARFVLCPRSNAAHGNGEPDVTHFVDAGISFSLGTDSLGSVPDLSLWAEMRAAHSLYKGRMKDAEVCRELYRAATENGAAAVGLPGGILAPGAPADFTVVDDPGGEGDVFFRNLVERTDRPGVRLTLVAGLAVHGKTA